MSGLVTFIQECWVAYRVIGSVEVDIVYCEPFDGLKCVFILPDTAQGNPLALLEDTV